MGIPSLAAVLVSGALRTIAMDDDEPLVASTPPAAVEVDHGHVVDDDDNKLEVGKGIFLNESMTVAIGMRMMQAQQILQHGAEIQLRAKETIAACSGLSFLAGVVACLLTRRKKK